MVSEEFPGNSRNVLGNTTTPPGTPVKNVEKVTTGVVVQKPPSLGKKVKGIFFNGDFKSAATYILTDVLLPAVKNTIVDMTTRGIERIVYGEAGTRRRFMTDPRRQSYFQYNRPIERGPMGLQYGSTMLPQQPPHYPPRQTRAPQAGDIILATREDAEAILQGLVAIIDQYDVATVADLHDLAGLPTVHTDHKWGWLRLGTGVGIKQIREGFLIDLPQPEPIQ